MTLRIQQLSELESSMTLQLSQLNSFRALNSNLKVSNLKSFILDSEHCSEIFSNIQGERDKEDNPSPGTPSLETIDLLHAQLCCARAAEVKTIVLHDRCNLPWSGLCWGLLGPILGSTIVTC